MKTIIFYSGKGGVGKTTITGLIAMELVRKGKKVAILDADINTPSMPILFPNSVIGTLKVFSIGYETTRITFYDSGVSEAWLRRFAKEIKIGDFDYLLIDTPPSVFSIHQKLFTVFNISSAVLITQPTRLSINDVKKTVQMFYLEKVPVVGVVYNMMNESFSKIDNSLEMNILAQIPMDKKLNISIENQNFKQYKNSHIKKLMKTILKIKDITWKEYEGSVIFPSVTKKDIDNIIFETKSPKKHLRFYNLATWDYVVDKLQENGICEDRFLIENTTETIERMLKPFESSDKAMFLIVKNPNTEIPTFPGEVGMASLILGREIYYQIPRIEYQTDEGTVTLFPHEVSPFDVKEFKYEEYVLYPNTDVQRYLPKPEIMKQISKSYGALVGCPIDWEDKYKKLKLLNTS